MMTMLLTGCSNKQPAVEPDEAERIASSIVKKISTSTSAYEVPDSYKIVYESSQIVTEKIDGKKTVTGATSRYTYLYSKQKHILFVETSVSELSASKDSEQIDRYWYILENDKLCAYTSSTYNNETSYSYGTSSITGLLENTAISVFKSYNNGLISDIESLRYSTDTPTSEDIPSEAIITYKTYYGSKNENSLQAEENLTVKTNDYVDENNEHKYMKGHATNKAVVEDCILKSLLSEASAEIGFNDGTKNNSSLTIKTSYTCSNYQGTPKLNKDLWKDAKNK